MELMGVRAYHRLMHGAPCVFQSAMKKNDSDGKTIKFVDSASSKPTFNGMNVSNVRQKFTLLPIVPVVIRSPSLTTYNTFALLDCSSEVTLLCEDVRKCLICRDQRSW